MSIRDMEMLGIGKPNDVGGTETAGTVMAKENEILKMLNGYKSKVKGNMILKRTAYKSFTASSNGSVTIEFEFENPVRIIEIYFSRGTGDTKFNTAYIINGEDSFTCDCWLPKTGAHLITLNHDYSHTNGPIFSSGSGGMEGIIYDTWATKLVFSFGSESFPANSTITSFVIYQEEAR